MYSQLICEMKGYAGEIKHTLLQSTTYRYQPPILFSKLVSILNRCILTSPLSQLRQRFVRLIHN